MKRAFTLVFFTFFLHACGQKTPTVLKEPELKRSYGSEAFTQLWTNFFEQTYSDTTSIEVIYATNRLITGNRQACTDEAFGYEMGAGISYGTCTVNVPKKHGTGQIEIAPSPRADTHKYFRVLEQKVLNEAALRQQLQSKSKTDALVFVHGFNVRFQEAFLRAAQIAYDIRFQGPIILFSWPAGSENDFLSSARVDRVYAANRTNARGSMNALSKLFGILNSLGIKTHVVVHSMGHQVVIPALAQLSVTEGRRPIGELILNAPDIGVEEFHDLIPNVLKVVDRTTLYCSYNDNAIAASEKFNDERRMGACEQISGVDVINVGEVDAPALGVGGLGHSYYASRPILTDIAQVLFGIPAEYRLFIRKSEPNSTENFYLRP